VDALSGSEATSRSDDSPCPFRTEERRIVDLIVELTTERVAQLLDAREQGPPGYAPPPHAYPPHGYGPPPPPEPHHGPRGPRRR
jgi:hypothetical protein